MHLLYLDDSGAVGNANEQYLVLGGVSVFEAQSYWITQELDRLAENINPGNPHDASADVGRVSDAGYPLGSHQEPG